MKTLSITASAFVLSLSISAAVNAANFLPEEPYANYAIGQQVASNEATEGAMMAPQHNNAMHGHNLFWGEGAKEIANKSPELRQ